MANSGPIAVQAVANLVAHEAATATAGGLLEGSHSVMMAVTRRGSDTSNTVNNSLAASCDMSRTATGGEGHSRCSSVDTELKGAGAGTSSNSCPGSPGAAALAVVAGESSSRNDSPLRAAGHRQQQESLAQTLSRKLSQTLKLGSSNGSSTGSTPTAAAGAVMDRSTPHGQLSCLGPHGAAISKCTTAADAAAGGSAMMKGLPISPSSASASSSYFSSSSRQQHPQLGHQRHRHTGSGTMSAVTATTPAGASVADELSDVSSEDGEVAHDNFVAWMTSHEISALDTDELSDYYPDQLPDWDDQAAGQQSAASVVGVSADCAAAGQPGAAVGLPLPSPGSTGGPSALSSGVDGSHGCAGGPAAGAGASLVSAADASALVMQAQKASAGADRGSSAAEGPGSGVIAGQPLLPPIKTGAVPSGIPSGNATRGAGSAGAAAATGSSSSSSSGLQQKARVALPGRALMPAGINDTVVPIFDSEPTSIAAYFLSSRSYQLQVNAAMKQILHDDKVRQRQQQQQQTAGAGSSSDMPGTGTAAAAATPTASTTAPHHKRVPSGDLGHRRQGSVSEAIGAAVLRGPHGAPGADGGSSSTSIIDKESGAGGLLQVQQHQQPDEGETESATTSMAPAAPLAASNSISTQGQQQPPGTAAAAGSTGRQAAQPRLGQAALQEPDWLELLLSPEPFHVKQGFDDDSPGMPWLRARFSVTAYFAPQFAELRRRCIIGGEAAYITSLSRWAGCFFGGGGVCRLWELAVGEVFLEAQHRPRARSAWQLRTAASW
jgi:hypothetical protein